MKAFYRWRSDGHSAGLYAPSGMAIGAKNSLEDKVQCVVQGLFALTF